MKLDLLTNATVIDDAMKFVSDKSKESLKLPKDKEDSNKQQLREEQPDYHSKHTELEEEQEIEETGEVTTKNINQVF